MFTNRRYSFHSTLLYYFRIRSMREFGILDYFYRRELVNVTECLKPVKAENLRPLSLGEFYGMISIYLGGDKPNVMSRESHYISQSFTPFFPLNQLFHKHCSLISDWNKTLRTSLETTEICLRCALLNVLQNGLLSKDRFINFIFSQTTLKGLITDYEAKWNMI